MILVEPNLTFFEEYFNSIMTLLLWIFLLIVLNIKPINRNIYTRIIVSIVLLVVCGGILPKISAKKEISYLKNYTDSDSMQESIAGLFMILYCWFIGALSFLIFNVTSYILQRRHKKRSN